MSKYFFLLVFCFNIITSKCILARDISIIANVNDEIITNIDLENRLNLALIISKLPNEEEIKKRLRSQVLKVLIEETLKIQEANRLGIYVTTEEVLTDIKNLELRLNLKPDSLVKDFGKRNVPEITILNQIRSQILWRKLLYVTVIKNLKIPDAQLEEALEAYIRTSGGMEYNFSEIFISFMTSDEETSKKKMQSIISKATPENFSLLAEQFSDGAVIYEDNNTNWTREDILTEKEKEILAKLEIGKISSPIKGKSGYHLYLINDKRKTEKIEKNQTYYDLGQIYFKLDKENRIEKINYYKQLLFTMREVINGCNDLEKAIEETSEGIGGRMGIVKKESVEKSFIKVLDGLAIGKLSNITISKDGIHALMLCSPVIENSLTKLKDNLETKIRYIKINNSSQLYLNRLRKKALIEVRNNFN